MNLEEFAQTYAAFTSKQKITICCDVCGKSRTITKERAQNNIQRHGFYIERSCSMKSNHQLFPRSDATKQKQREGRLGKKHSEESKQQMSTSANEKWKTDWGKQQKKRLSKLAVRQHGSTNLDKSKRKILYVSAKNGGQIRTCNSSYEFIFCDHYLEKDDTVVSYETQVAYEVEGRSRSLDFLITYQDSSKEVVEVKPVKRMFEAANDLQLKDSFKNAQENGYTFSIRTETDLGITNIKEATRLADEYRKQHYDLDYDAHRKTKAVERSQKHYEKHIKNDKIKVFCDYCQEEHTIMQLSYDLNMDKNGRFICIKENGSIVGKKPKLHLQKENKYANLNQKQCTKCVRILPFECFGSDKSRHDGFASRCKECRIEKKLRID